MRRTQVSTLPVGDVELQTISQLGDVRRESISQTGGGPRELKKKLEAEICGFYWNNVEHVGYVGLRNISICNWNNLTMYLDP